MSKYGIFFGPYFPAFRLNTKRYCLSVFSPNAGKYLTEKVTYLDTFHTVKVSRVSVSKNIENCEYQKICTVTTHLYNPFSVYFGRDREVKDP